MTTGSSARPPFWFWLVAAIGLLMSLFGLVALAGALFGPPNPAGEAHGVLLWADRLLLVGLAVGIVGYTGLELRRRWTIPWQVASLLLVLPASFYSIVIVPASGGGITAVLLALRLFLLWFTIFARARDWLSR